MNRRSTWLSIVVATWIAAATTSSHAQTIGHRVDLRADIDGPNGERASVIYRERAKENGPDRRFILRVTNAVPGRLYEFFLNGVLHAAATADDTGLALLRARTPRFIDDATEWVPLPQTFPPMFQGDAVRVGLLFGLMQREQDDVPPDQRIDLEGDLLGPGSAHGRVTWRERLNANGLDRRLILRVNDLVPGQLVLLYVNGEQTVGATADDDGVALLRARTAAFIDDPADWDVLPQSFPPLLAGDAITAGRQSAFMYDTDEGLFEASQRIATTSVFGVPGFLNGVASYTERRRRDNLERTFDVQLLGAGPNAVLPVLINGFQVGQVVADANGRGRLRVHTPAYREPGELPMPDAFPSILPGWVITVGVQNGAFFRSAP